MKGFHILLLGVGLVLGTQVSCGPAPSTVSNRYPESHFFRAPHLASFEIIEDGRIRRHEEIKGGRPADGRTLRAVIGKPRLKQLDDSLRRPIVQQGRMTYTIPIAFTIDGKPAGESTVLTPVNDDSVEIRLQVSRFGLYLHDPERQKADDILIAAIADGVRARAENGNLQTEIKRLHGVTPR